MTLSWSENIKSWWYNCLTVNANINTSTIAKSVLIKGPRAISQTVVIIRVGTDWKILIIDYNSYLSYSLGAWWWETHSIPGMKGPLPQTYYRSKVWCINRFSEVIIWIFSENPSITICIGASHSTRQWFHFSIGSFCRIKQVGRSAHRHISTNSGRHLHSHKRNSDRLINMPPL